MEEPKIKYVLLLPLSYNDGRLVPLEVLDGMLDEIFVLAGGYSIAGTVRGAYRMNDGTKQRRRIVAGVDRDSRGRGS